MSISSEEHWKSSNTWTDEYECFTGGIDEIEPHITILIFRL